MLSVIIITRNEEANIARCLKSVQWADELIVMDSGSTDNTIAIANEYTNNIYTAEWGGYGLQKQRALELATSDWVLNLDADEVATEELKEVILEAMADNEADAYRIPIVMNFYGKNLRYSSSPSRHVRLFKREGASYSKDLVHEKVILPKNARINRLSQMIIHYCYRDIGQVLYKLNLYSSETARIRIKKGDKPTFMGVMFTAGWMFFRCFVLQRGFLDRQEGLLMAIFNMQESFYRGIKQIYPDQKTAVKLDLD